MITERAAEPSDITRIVSLTRAQRRQLAEWSPVYFNPRDGADEAHAGFLGFLVESSDHETVVLEADGETIGFFVRIPQDYQLWIDDLCVDDAAHWPAVASTLMDAVGEPWATCVSVRDRVRIAALHRAGCRTISTYYARRTAAIEPLPQHKDVSIEADGHAAARHTFGGRPFASDVSGALCIADSSGYVIGSPSTSPPIYDPGGPTCVIDQIAGQNRRALLGHAVGVAAGRGDSQVIVVVDAADDELDAVVSDLGFSPEVLLVGK